MDIKSYIDFSKIKLLPPPRPGLRRSWADSSSPLEIASLASYNKNQSVKELNNLFDHINEIKYNKLIYREYALKLTPIFKKYSNVGINHTTMYKKIVIDYLIDVNHTRFV